jgi:hypothetical protein
LTLTFQFFTNTHYYISALKKKIFSFLSIT